MKITPASLLPLQTYRLVRRSHRQRMIGHRRARSVALGPHMRLQFEDELTVRYQIQEVLHAEQPTEPDAAAHEIGTYAHLVPDGGNWKATLQIEIADAALRRDRLPRLNDAAHCVYVDVAGQPRVTALANEDLPDGHRGRPSAVHFLRFELPPPVRAAVLAGAAVALGCDHDHYAFCSAVPAATAERLRRDLAPLES